MIGQEEIRTLADYNQNWIVFNPRYALLAHIQITFGFVHSFVSVNLFKFRRVVVGLLFCLGPSNLLCCQWLLWLDHSPNFGSSTRLVGLFWVQFGPPFGPYEWTIYVHLYLYVHVSIQYLKCYIIIWYFVLPTSTQPQPNQPPLLQTSQPLQQDQQDERAQRFVFPPCSTARLPVARWHRQDLGTWGNPYLEDHPI